MGIRQSMFTAGNDDVMGIRQSMFTAGNDDVMMMSWELDSQPESELLA